jgi:cbb3-type cytochrome oxidase subunit 3
MKNKALKVTIFILVLVIIAGVVWYEKIKKQQMADNNENIQQLNQETEQNNNENQTENTKEDKQDMAAKNIEDKKAKFTSFLETNKTEVTIKNVLENRARYNKKIGNIDIYQKNIESLNPTNNPWFSIGIVSYKYNKGGSFQDGYEGLKWTVELDKEVNAFLSLKEDVQVSNMLGHLGDEKVTVELRKIGINNYAVYDTFFKPGANWTRYYMTFDSKNSRVIFITFSFTYYDEQKDHETTYSFDKSKGYFENIIYPQEIDEYLKVIESIIANS